MFKNIWNHEADFPTNISEEAKDLIEQLIEKDPKNRLGACEQDADAVMSHKWFECIVWEDLHNKKLNPPYKPDPAEDGLNYFDEEFTSEDINNHIRNFSPPASNKSISDHFSGLLFN